MVYVDLPALPTATVFGIAFASADSTAAAAVVVVVG